MPKYPGICPSNVEIDVYRGCSFRCVYCIARSRHEEPVRPVSRSRLLAATAERGRHPVYLSPWTDAYQPLERTLRQTRELIERLVARDRPFFVVTRSDLVLGDAEIFASRERSFVAISLNTLDDAVLERLEPAAPRAAERQRLIAELIRCRVKTVVKIDPILPGITDGKRLSELLGWLVRVRPFAVTAETLRLSRGIAARLEAELTAAQWQRLHPHYPPTSAQANHPRLGYRLDLFEAIAAALGRAGVRASFCKASLPRAVTSHDCRGGF